MADRKQLAQRHDDVTRRYFLQISVAGATGISAIAAWGAADDSSARLDEVIAQLEYLTPPDNFRIAGRGNPKPHTLPPERLREVGLVPETWKLEVIPDPDSNADVKNPLTRQSGTALDWQGLMKLAETKAVRYMEVMSCTNAAGPFGMGLWEGVPLRDVIWLAQPTGNVRRVFYYGYHNDDPDQRFQSSLPLGRVLEDPPGEQPVMLCYKLNGRLLSAKAGAPVRMIVPGQYGNKSVKWLQRIVLTNNHRNNDTYAEWNNDTASPLKTCARFIHVPKKAKAGQAIPITGLAQVGMSGLRKVQYWLHPKNVLWPKDDPYFTKADWQDAQVLPPPEDFGGRLPDGELPPIPSQFDPVSGEPLTWPIRYTITHWATLLPAPPPGEYDLRCRTIDAAGIAQPMPRPFPKAGRNEIQSVPLTVHPSIEK